MMTDAMHVTVLLDEAVRALISDPDGRYVDGTFGRGGHARLILQSLSDQGCLVGIDKDPEAVSVARALAESDSRFSIEHGSFAQVKEFVDARGWDGATGILVDLGVSSPQLDDAGRGFSFMNDGPLDMRMDTSRGMSAADWIASVEESDLIRVLREYGEEKFAKRIAGAIVRERALAPIQTTSRLASIVAEANPSWEKHKHPATRAFQAIRIEVNKELADLELFLVNATKALAVQGRLVVISFHSLEDRMVKQFMRKLAKGDEPPPGVPVLESDITRRFKVMSKAMKPSKEEVERNPRARSAVMRVLEKLSDE
jgi:16S rRNA (cytosine1402-N4)-methyltransferase